MESGEYDNRVNSAGSQLHVEKGACSKEEGSFTGEEQIN